MYNSFEEKIINIEFINENLFYLVLSNSFGIKYEPGHCFSIKIPKININREYSICSIYGDKELVFLIRKIDGGLFTSYLINNLNKNDSLTLNGPYSEFFFPKKTQNNNLYDKYYLIATGTGVAPYISYVRQFSYLKPKIKILHGIRLISDMIPELLIDDIEYVPAISKEDSKKHFNGRVTDFLRAEKFDYTTNTCYYLCGNRKMISQTYDILVNEKEISSNNLISETFF